MPDNHPAFITTADEVVDRLRVGDRVAQRAPGVQNLWADEVLRLYPEAVYLSVPRGLDQPERLLLDLGTALGDDAIQMVDEGLRRTPDSVDDLLAALGRRLSDRPLVVQGWDALIDGGHHGELDLALHGRVSIIRRWLMNRPGLFIGARRLPLGVKVLASPRLRCAAPDMDEAPDLTVQALQLQAQALGALDLDAEATEGEDALRTRILAALPRGAARFLNLLALHERPLPDRLLNSTDRGLGLRTRLWSRIGDSVVLDPGWHAWIQGACTQRTRLDLHRTLAAAFGQDVRPDDRTALGRATSLLEAHRHLVSAGDFGRAQAYARYGAALLVDAARTRSLDGDHIGAAQIYDAVLGEAEAGRIPLPTRLRGYTRHYLHFNRAHAHAEPFPATEHGYVRALEDWPENALFWSRLVRARCLQGRFGDASVALEAAQTEVPEHPQKQSVLVARTVRGLLERGRHPDHHARLLDAIRLWGAYAPDSAFAEEVEERLVQVLESGWSTATLTLDEEAPLLFHLPTQIRIRRRPGFWLAELPGLDALLMARGPSPLAALTALIQTIRETVKRLVRAHTADLSPQERMHKRLLLGRVDVVASRLDAPHRRHHWYVGHLERDESDLVWLRTHGSSAVSFEVPAGLVSVLDERDYLAQVATDLHGIPVGPVVFLEPTCTQTDDELWAAWQARMNDGG